MALGTGFGLGAFLMGHFQVCAMGLSLAGLHGSVDGKSETAFLFRKRSANVRVSLGVARGFESRSGLSRFRPF